jgi:ribonuclease HII
MPLTYDKKFIDQGLVLAGIDEVGLGPIAGPIVAVCVVIPQDQVNALSMQKRRRIARINDSKQLQKDEHAYFYDKLHECAIGIGLGIVDVPEINQVKNIYKCGFMARFRALKAMRDRNDTIHCFKYFGGHLDYIIVDGDFGMPEVTFTQVIPLVKGDTLSLSVASASIIAKFFRDQYMTGLGEGYPQYNWAKNAGYGTKEHYQAIKKYGLTEYHREYLIHDETINSSGH